MACVTCADILAEGTDGGISPGEWRRYTLYLIIAAVLIGGFLLLRRKK